MSYDVFCDVLLFEAFVFAVVLLKTLIIQIYDISDIYPKYFDNIRHLLKLFLEQPKIVIHAFDEIMEYLSNSINI